MQHCNNTNSILPHATSPAAIKGRTSFPTPVHASLGKGDSCIFKPQFILLSLVASKLCTNAWPETAQVGSQMIRGISGGQKKRVTTAEMISGPKRTLFMVRPG